MSAPRAATRRPRPPLRSRGRCACRRTLPKVGAQRQRRGAALITALLVAALAALMVSGMMWQQWSAISREQDAREALQARWLLRGALDWSRLILREAGTTSQQVYLGQPWSVPLAEASLGTFLAAHGGGAGDLADTWLEGRITDAQARFNLYNLAPNGAPNDSAMRVLQRLDIQLGVEPSVGSAIAAGIAAANSATSSRSGVDAPLPLRRVLDLARLSPQVAAALPRLAPYVTLLPAATVVNANTAPAPVLAALLHISPDAAAQLVRARAQHYFKSNADITKALSSETVSNLDQIGFGSSFFEAIARVRIGHFEYAEKALMQRVNNTVQTLRVERAPPWLAQPQR